MRRKGRCRWWQEDKFAEALGEKQHSETSIHGPRGREGRNTREACIEESSQGVTTSTGERGDNGGTGRGAGLRRGEGDPRYNAIM